MACLVWIMLEEWFDSLRMAEELGGSSPQKAVWWCVFVADRLRGIVLTSVVCKVFVTF